MENKYIVICHSDFNTFVDLVNEKVREGYFLIGGIAVASEKTATNYDARNEVVHYHQATYYYQAMLLA